MLGRVLGAGITCDRVRQKACPLGAHSLEQMGSYDGRCAEGLLQATEVQDRKPRKEGSGEEATFLLMDTKYTYEKF